MRSIVKVGGRPARGLEKERGELVTYFLGDQLENGHIDDVINISSVFVSLYKSRNMSGFMKTLLMNGKRALSGRFFLQR